MSTVNHSKQEDLTSINVQISRDADTQDEVNRSSLVLLHKHVDSLKESLEELKEEYQAPTSSFSNENLMSLLLDKVTKEFLKKKQDAEQKTDEKAHEDQTEDLEGTQKAGSTSGESNGGLCIPPGMESVYEVGLLVGEIMRDNANYHQELANAQAVLGQELQNDAKDQYDKIVKEINKKNKMKHSFFGKLCHALGSLGKVGNILGAVIGVLLAGLSGGAAAALVVIVLTVMTQVNVGGHSLLEDTAAGLAKAMGGSKAAQIVADALVIAVVAAAAYYTGGAAGKMIMGEGLQGMSQKTATDIVAASGLTGMNAVALQIACQVVFTATAVALTVKGGCEAGAALAEKFSSVSQAADLAGEMQSVGRLFATAQMAGGVGAIGTGTMTCLTGEMEEEVGEAEGSLQIDSALTQINNSMMRNNLQQAKKDMSDYQEMIEKFDQFSEPEAQAAYALLG